MRYWCVPLTQWRHGGLHCRLLRYCSISERIVTGRSQLGPQPTGKNDIERRHCYEVVHVESAASCLGSLSYICCICSGPPMTPVYDHQHAANWGPYFLISRQATTPP